MKERGSQMTKLKWKNQIVKHCKAVGIYKDSFIPVIETLAEILEQRDLIREEFDESGARPVLIHTNKAGAENLSKNPLLVLWDEMNKSALAYWRDLGLTPAGLKRIDEQAVKVKKGNALAEALKELG